MNKENEFKEIEFNIFKIIELLFKNIYLIIILFIIGSVSIYLSYNYYTKKTYVVDIKSINSYFIEELLLKVQESYMDMEFSEQNQIKDFTKSISLNQNNLVELYYSKISNFYYLPKNNKFTENNQIDFQKLDNVYGKLKTNLIFTNTIEGSDNNLIARLNFTSISTDEEKETIDILLNYFLFHTYLDIYYELNKIVSIFNSNIKTEQRILDSKREKVIQKLSSLIKIAQELNIIDPLENNIILETSKNNESSYVDLDNMPAYLKGVKALTLELDELVLKGYDSELAKHQLNIVNYEAQKEIILSSNLFKQLSLYIDNSNLSKLSPFFYYNYTASKTKPFSIFIANIILLIFVLFIVYIKLSYENYRKELN